MKYLSLKTQVILQQWWTYIERIHASCLIPIETNVAICQEMADSQLLHDNRVPLRDLAPLFCCADSKKITHHSIFFDWNPCGPHQYVALRLSIVKLSTAVELAVAALDALHPKIECTISKTTKQYLRAVAIG
jgi:hypothetical protein